MQLQKEAMMADAAGLVFNRKAADKLRNPDDLDKYICVTNASTWVVVIACAALFAGLLIWGIFGAVSTSVSATGTLTDEGVVCFLDAEEAAGVKVGDAANVAGEQMKVAGLTAVPYSRDEARTLLENDYLVNALVEGDWSYGVTFEGDGEYDFAKGVPLTVTITTSRVAPISLILES